MGPFRMMAALLAILCLGACGARKDAAGPQVESSPISSAVASSPASDTTEQEDHNTPEENPLTWVRETYLDPLGWDLVIGKTFTSPREIGTDWMFYFEDIALYQQQQGLASPLDDYPDGCYPVTVVTSCLTQYFEVDGPTILAGVQADFRSQYDPVAGTITHENGRGGVGNRVEVTSYTEADGNASIEYQLQDFYTGEPRKSYRMEVRLLEDGSFRYLSIQEA